MLRIWWHGERVANIPARRLADESPVIRTPSVKPGYIVDEPVAVDDAAYPRPKDLGAALTQLLAAPNIASKRWAWEQYDYIVQANTMQTVSYTHLRAHETRHDLVCRLLLEKKKHNNSKQYIPPSYVLKQKILNIKKKIT